MFFINNSLSLPISGAAQQNFNTIKEPEFCRSVALLGTDYHGIKPKLAVALGDGVKVGQPLWHDKDNAMLAYTSPAGGVVSAIHRGYKRTLLSVVIDINQKQEPYEQFTKYSSSALKELKTTQVRQQLQQSGLWSVFRTRPFSRVPHCQNEADAIFVNAMDTQPLAADSVAIIKHHQQEFLDGLEVLSCLTDKKIYVCRAAGTDVAIPNIKNIHLAEFSGAHPAGLSGTHIHHLAPVSRSRSVWTIDYAAIIAIGHLFTTGQLMTERIISLAGPGVLEPCVLKTRIGADLTELCAGKLMDGEQRVISGSVLSGNVASGALSYLGHYHRQVSVIAEGRERELMGWWLGSRNKFSNMGIYLHSYLKNKKEFSFSTSTNGSERAMVPTGNYERVMPLDLLITPLLRYLIIGDSAMAEKLGCLELDEEDLSLCTYVCSAKYEYGHILRSVLDHIYKEG